MRCGSSGRFAFAITRRGHRDDQKLNRQTLFSRRVAKAQRGTTSLQFTRERRGEQGTSQLVLVARTVLALLCASASWRETAVL